MITSVARTVGAGALIIVFGAKAAAGAVLEKPIARAPFTPPPIHSWAKWPGATDESAKPSGARSQKPVSKASAPSPVPAALKGELPQSEGAMVAANPYYNYTTASTAGGAAVNYEITAPDRGRGGGALDAENVVLRSSVIDSVMTYMNSLYGYTILHGWWYVTNPFSPPDSFNVNVDRIRAEPGHVTEYYWNIFVPQGSRADPADTVHFDSALYGTLTVQGNPYGSARVWVVSTADSSIEAIIAMAGAYHDSIQFVAADPLPVLPNSISISVYPNPFNGRATVSYEVTRPVEVGINVYNIAGQLVLPVFEGMANPGLKNLPFDMDGFASGVFFLTYREKATGAQKTVKLILEK